MAATKQRMLFFNLNAPKNEQLSFSSPISLKEETFVLGLLEKASSFRFFLVKGFDWYGMLLFRLRLATWTLSSLACAFFEKSFWSWTFFKVESQHLVPFLIFAFQCFLKPSTKMISTHIFEWKQRFSLLLYRFGVLGTLSFLQFANHFKR